MHVEQDLTHGASLSVSVSFHLFNYCSITSQQSGSEQKERLIDGFGATFWQSRSRDRPHWIQFVFPEDIEVAEVALNLNYFEDHTYTPLRLALALGRDQSQLREVCSLRLNRPRGWVQLSPKTKIAESVQVVRVLILENHDNGGDTRIRQIKVWGIRKGSAADAAQKGYGMAIHQEDVQN